MGENFYFYILGLVEKKGQQITEKLGLTRHNVDYCFVCFDEAFEFTKQDFMNVKMALGGYKEWIIFKCSNPFAPSSPYFIEFLEQLPFDLKTMKEVGQQKKFIPETKTLYHWTNYIRAVKDGFLSPDTVKAIESADKDDPLFGDVMKYGKPALLQGGIYNTQQIIYLTPQQSSFDLFKTGDIHIGIDFGYSIGDTVVEIVCVDEEQTRVLHMAELIIDNKKKQFDLALYTRWIIDFIGGFITTYNLEQDKHFTVYCDKDYAWVDALQQAFSSKYPDISLAFVQVPKLVISKRIADRIRGVVRCLSGGMFYMLKGEDGVKSGEGLIREMELAYWDMDTTNKDKYTRDSKCKDHCLDAFEYALYPVINLIGRLF